MFELSIITAEKLLFNGKVKMLIAPTETGEVGILPNHHPLLAKLGLGPLKLTAEDGSSRNLFVAGGFLEVNENLVTVLADTADNIDEIEREQVVRARLAAEEALKNAKSEIEKEKLLAEIKIQMVKEQLAGIAKFKK